MARVRDARTTRAGSRVWLCRPGACAWQLARLLASSARPRVCHGVCATGQPAFPTTAPAIVWRSARSSGGARTPSPSSRP
eukprot:2590405-Prymnesium_polylepis.1